jgi:hypothetical protein
MGCSAKAAQASANREEIDKILENILSSN